jgi:acyl-CoA thioester hydrolase
MEYIMTTLPKELQSTALIRFQDCDPFGHLNNARYIDYFMNARVDQLAEHYDFHLFDHMQREHENWLVSKTQIQYVYPAAFNTQVNVRTRLIEVTDRLLIVEAIMIDGHHLLALAWIEFTLIDTTTGRPKHHSADLMNFFQSIRVEGIYNPLGFDTRVQEIKKELRSVAA